MKRNLFMTNHGFLRRWTSCMILIVFSATSILMPAKASAQSVGIPGVNLPVVGSMVGVSPAFAPPIIRGMSIYPDNPLKFDFIINTGDENIAGAALAAESQKLIKYFLASLTTPEDEFWVNLSPYESGRIIPQALGVTEMGRDMLAQDYMLKQLTASLIYPEQELGSQFWQRVQEKAKKLYGINEVPVSTFNKVWIMPDKAAVYEHENRVFVVEQHLKVMLEEDWMAMQKTLDAGRSTLEKATSDQPPASNVATLSSNILRELVIPEIEKEVNEGRNFATVRQIYNSMILATWYKKRLRESLLGQVYVNQNKTKGIDLDDKETKQKIYEQYLAAFKKGVYNYIKEDIDALTNEPIPRKYFSGGLAKGVVTVAGLMEYNGALASQSPAVVVAVTRSPVKTGSDVVVSSSLVENAKAGDVDIVSPSLESSDLPSSPFADVKPYLLTGAIDLDKWNIMMSNVPEDERGFLYDFLVWSANVPEVYTLGVVATVVGVAVLLANDPIGYLRNTVEYNLKWARNVGDYSAKRYTYLNRIVNRGTKVVPELLAELENSNVSPQTVRNIAYVLGKLGDVRAVDPLMKKLEQRIESKDVIVALGNLKAAQAVDMLIEQLSDSSLAADIVSVTIEALGKIGDEKAFEQLIKLLFEFRIDHVDIITALGNLGDKRAIEPLVRFIQSERYNHELGYAVDALGKLAEPGDQQIIQFLIGLLTLGNSSYSLEIVVALQRLGGEEGAVDLLLEMLSAEEGKISRSSVVKALGMLGGSKVVELLLESLINPEWATRAAAREALKQFSTIDDPRLKKYDIVVKASNNLPIGAEDEVFYAAYRVVSQGHKLKIFYERESVVYDSEYHGSGDGTYDPNTPSRVERVKPAMVKVLDLTTKETVYEFSASSALGETPLWTGNSKSYLLTGAASQWSVSMGGVIESIQGFGLDAVTWAGQGAEFATDNPWTVFLTGVALYAIAEFDPVGYFGDRANSPKQLYNKAYKKIRSVVGYDKINQYSSEVQQVYSILLRGGDFMVNYIPEQGVDPIDFGGWDNGDHPLAPQYREIIPASLEIIEIQRNTRPDAASSALDQNEISQGPAKVVSAPTVKPVGGIDFNSAALDLQIKRDDNGVPLALPQQTIENMRIDGFYPVIINIAPIQVPLLFGMKIEEEPQKLSAL